MKLVDEMRATLIALLVVFTTLKLSGLVDWPWWFVTLPFWAPVALSAVCYAFAGVMFLCLGREGRSQYHLQRDIENLVKGLRR